MLNLHTTRSYTLVIAQTTNTAKILTKAIHNCKKENKSKTPYNILSCIYRQNIMGIVLTSLLIAEPLIILQPYTLYKHCSYPSPTWQLHR